MGKYPIFIFSTGDTSKLDDTYLPVRIIKLVRELAQRLPDESARRRVYSVFAANPVASAFAFYWKEATGIASIEEPYYDAKFSYCNKESLAGPVPLQDHTYTATPRLGVMSDVYNVSRLCHGFAADSVSAHTLSVEGILH